MALGLEALQHGVRVHAALDYLDRDSLIELAVRPMGEKDDSHAAAAEFAIHGVRPHPLERSVAGRELRYRIIRRVESQQSVHFLAQVRIAGAGRLDERGSIRRAEFERLANDIFDAVPLLTIHSDLR